MLSRIQRSPLFVSCFVGLTLALVLGAVAVVLADEGVASHDDTIKELLKKRLVVLTNVHDLQMKSHEVGVAHYRQVVEDQKAMFNAQLDLCDTKEDRIRVHQEVVKVAKEMSQYMIAVAKTGRAKQVDVLKAEAYLIETQIALERAKASN